jgi:Family of unknown function (DUF5906)/Bifunctional DNA primase/polymerase, N-terminal/Primase C terminal 2 (PriCT-2)
LTVFVLDPIQLWDRGFGPRMIPVTPPPPADISPSSKLTAKVMGKAPGRPTQAGWTGIDIRQQANRCLDYGTARTWKEDWGANVGFVTGDGYVVIDNDQGEEFSAFLSDLCTDFGIEPLRRFVLDPKHKRDAFFFRVLDFVGDGAAVQGQNITFRRGVNVAKIQILASGGQQLVISGIHRDTHSPYVWNREIEDIAEIPVLSEDGFSGFIRKFVELLKAVDWKPDGGVSVSPRPKTQTQTTVATAIATTQSAPNSTALNPKEITDTKALLARFPNRDVPPGETPNTFDIWLDDYVNWLTVGYALMAHLGAGADTAEAEEIWTEWSDGRTQVKQNSRDTWRSIIKQTPKVGAIKLVALLRERGALPPETFPDVDPHDPAFQAPVTPIWDTLRPRWAFYAPKGGFLDMRAGAVVPRQAFTDLHADMSAALGKELGFKKRAKMNAADVFVAQPSKLIVSNLTYDPGAPPLTPTVTYPVFNKWRPTKVKRQVVSPSQVKPWLDHVAFVLGASESDRFVKWCAFVAQCPELKPNWHYLVMSAQGVGKDTMLAPVKAAVGAVNAKEAMIKQLNDGFNDSLETKLLIVGETHQPRWTAHEVASNLKHVLARPPEFLTINQKYIVRYEIPNRIAVIMFSNEANPLQLDRNQRRVHVVNRRDIDPKPPAYYAALWDWLNAGGTDLTAAYLLALPLSDAEKRGFIGGVAPSSNAKAGLEEMNVDAALAVLEGIINDSRAGIGPFNNLVGTADQLAEQVGQKIRKPTPQVMHGWLMDMEYQKRGVRRLRIDPKNHNHCGVVHSKGIGARLWVLGDKTPQGADWSSLTNAEIIAMWQGKPPPRSASVLQFPLAKDEEMI